MGAPILAFSKTVPESTSILMDHNAGFAATGDLPLVFMIRSAAGDRIFSPEGRVIGFFFICACRAHDHAGENQVVREVVVNRVAG